MPRNAASLLIRLSREAREESTGLTTQEADLRSLAAQHGLDVVAVHTDDGLSGAIRNRPGFLAWLEDGRSGRADHLLAWKLDRVSRGGAAGVARFLDVVEGLDADGKKASEPVRFLSYADHLDSATPTWDVQVAVMAAIAKSELDAIKERTRRSKAQVKAEGRYLGGVLPAGFRAVANPDGPGKIVEPDPEKIEHIRKAARLLVTDSLSAATHYLQKSTVRPPRAADWTRNTTAQLMLCEAAMTKLWTPSEARAIRAALGDRKPRVAGRKRVRRMTLLAGVAFCSGCRRPLVFSSKGQRGASRYQCQSWQTAHPCEAKSSVQAPMLDEVVEEAYLDGWGDMKETKVISLRDERADEIAILRDELDALLGSMAGRTSAERREVLDKADALEAEIARLEAEPSAVTTIIRETGRTRREAWEASDVVERNAILRRVGAEIYLRPGAAGRRAHKLDPARVDGLGALRDPQ